MSILLAVDPNAEVESTPDAGDTVTTDAGIATLRIDHDGTLVFIFELGDGIDVYTIPPERVDAWGLAQGSFLIRDIQKQRDARGEVAA